MSPQSHDPSPGHVPLLPQDWVELAPLLDAVLDVPPDRRAGKILEMSGGNPARARALTELLFECERDLPLLNGGAAERFDDLVNGGSDPLLPELVGDRYQVGRELGRGGMARVYLARDLKHGRDVAIKVIRPELSASLGHERFLREIEIAARLNHPNIVPLHDSGEVDGSLYFVMPYQEGPSLGERLARDGALPIADALSALRDVARALAYAHEHGVVHRDVKPDNVMLSSGAAVVTDFGIAKAVSDARTEQAGLGRTPASSPMGTPAYSAPEQSSGDPSTDHRADIYSFGCLAYELLTGRPPFPDPSVPLVLAAHAGTVPLPVTAFRPEVSPLVADLIARCLNKRPVDRPQSAGELLDSLDRAASPPARRLGTALRWSVVGVGLGILAAVGFLVTRAPRSDAPLTMTVVPFVNSGTDSTMELVAEGLADEVATALAGVAGIRITSRSGARLYRGQMGVDVTEAGTRLKADYVMTGVARQQQGHWILSLDLARTSDATSVWGEQFDLGPDQQAGAADSIAGHLVASLRSRFGPSIGVAPVRSQTSNREAHRLYLKGQEMLDRRGQSIKGSVDFFREAIRQDTLYARAWSGLSLALALHPMLQGIPVSAVRDEMVRAAQRALQLDPTLAQPHVTLGMAHGFALEWDSAAAEFRTAIGLDARHVESRNQYARHLRNRGRLPEALQQLRAARALDPISAVVVSQMSYVYYLLGQIDSALVESRRALQNDPLGRTSLALGALVRLANNDPAEARRLIDQAPSTSPIIGYVIAKSGDLNTARQRLAALDAQSPQPWMAETNRAYTYLGLGDTARALSALERATDAGEIWPAVESFRDPMYDPIRRSSRFQALLRRVGLPD